jgi:hypothetical protein
MTETYLSQLAGPRPLVRVAHIPTNDESKAVHSVHPTHHGAIDSAFGSSLVRETHKTADICGLGVGNGRHAHQAGRREPWA